MSPRYVRAAAFVAAFAAAPAVSVMRASAGTVAATALYYSVAPRPPGMIGALNHIAFVQHAAGETFLQSARMLALAAESTVP